MGTINTLVGPVTTQPDLSNTNSDWWVGQDNNVYQNGVGGVQNKGAYISSSDGGYEAQLASGVGTQIADWNQPAATNTGTYSGGSSGDGGAAQQAENQKQIDAINRMLGISSTKKTAGVASINAGYTNRKNQLASDQARTNQGYKDQTLQNEQARTRGYEQVDNFANTSQNNLQRIFQGANAGNSSVSRLLAPHLVGKAAGSRRLGVTQTAGENAQGIAGAQSDADYQYKTAYKDAELEKAKQEQDFLASINEGEADLYAKKQAFEQAGGIANADTQAQIDKRFATLNSLFGQVPTYSAKRMDFKKPELGKYTVDPAQIGINQGAVGPQSYYGRQLKKKQEMA